MPLVIPWRTSTDPVLPTTNLYAKFDANDVAKHTLASGIWAPSTGSDATTLLATASTGTVQTFAYGTRKNGLLTIDCPTSIEFRPSTADTVTVSDWTILMAFNLISGGSNGFIAGEYSTGDSYRWLYGTDTFDIGNGVETNRINSTGFSTAGWRVVGAVFNATEGKVTQLYSGDYYEDATRTFEGVLAVSVLRHALTAYGGAMTVGAGNTADIEIGEILIYSDSNVGKALKAMEYLRNRWGI